MSDTNQSQQPAAESFRSRLSRRTKKIMNFFNSLLVMMMLATFSVYFITIGIPPEFVAAVIAASVFAYFVSSLIVEKLFPFIASRFKKGSKND